jgi:AraC-like DNA-binding protein
MVPALALPVALFQGAPYPAWATVRPHLSPRAATALFAAIAAVADFGQHALSPRRAPSLPSVAWRLGTSARSLQRRLENERTTFAQVVDHVRRERAEVALQAPDVAIGEVSWLLGFSDQSAFARAFRRWTGQSPARWRRARAAGRD